MAGWRRMLEWLEDAHLLRGEPDHDGPSALTGSKWGVAGWVREVQKRPQCIRGVPSKIEHNSRPTDTTRRQRTGWTATEAERRTTR